MRTLGLGVARLKDLQSYRGRDGTDLASTVERVMVVIESDFRHGRMIQASRWIRLMRPCIIFLPSHSSYRTK
jgi:hypothetical protein